MVAWAGLLGGLAGCTADGGSPIEIQLPGKPRSPDEAIRITPDDNAKGVPADGPLTVSVPEGRLERVVVTKVEDAQEGKVPGAIAVDGLSWSPDPAAGRLALAAKYTVDAVALDGHNRRQARHTTFTTYVPEERFIGYFKPENRSTVGTGMIISFNFNRSVERRADVERAITITSDPAVEVVGHWFGTERLDFRPKAYWKPGTEVTVKLNLRDVEGALPARTASRTRPSASPSAAPRSPPSTRPRTRWRSGATASCCPPCRSPPGRPSTPRTTARWW